MEKQIKADHDLMKRLEKAFDELPYWFSIRSDAEKIQIESYDFFPGDGRGEVKYEGDIPGLKAWLSSQNL